MIAKYAVSGVTRLVAQTENYIESNVTLVYALDAFGLVKVKKAELVIKYIAREGVRWRGASGQIAWRTGGAATRRSGMGAMIRWRRCGAAWGLWSGVMIDANGAFGGRGAG